MSGTVVIFDFDKTIIDCDSDNWVVDELGFTDLFECLLPTMPWNSLMDRMMKEVHANGRSVDDIAEVLKRAPLDQHVISAIKSAYALGCDLRVVSDANVFFIETILNHHGLIGCFVEINTNPSYVDEEGRLRIFPYHDFTKSSHGCPLCPPNMCKSMIVERIRASALDEGKRIVYLGDGKGDYCPSLRLGEGDFVMPRRNYPCWDLIMIDPSAIKAEVRDGATVRSRSRSSCGSSNDRQCPAVMLCLRLCCRRQTANWSQCRGHPMRCCYPKFCGFLSKAWVGVYSYRGAEVFEVVNRPSWRLFLPVAIMSTATVIYFVENEC